MVVGVGKALSIFFFFYISCDYFPLICLFGSMRLETPAHRRFVRSPSVMTEVRPMMVTP